MLEKSYDCTAAAQDYEKLLKLISLETSQRDHALKSLFEPTFNQAYEETKEAIPRDYRFQIGSIDSMQWVFNHEGEFGEIYLKLFSEIPDNLRKVSPMRATNFDDIDLNSQHIGKSFGIMLSSFRYASLSQLAPTQIKGQLGRHVAAIITEIKRINDEWKLAHIARRIYDFREDALRQLGDPGLKRRPLHDFVRDTVKALEKVDAGYVRIR